MLPFNDLMCALQCVRFIGTSHVTSEILGSQTIAIGINQSHIADWINHCQRAAYYLFIK